MKPEYDEEAANRSAELSALREAIGWQQSDVAAAMGVSERSAKRWERGLGGYGAPDAVLRIVRYEYAKMMYAADDAESRFEQGRDVELVRMRPASEDDGASRTEARMHNALQQMIAQRAYSRGMKVVWVAGWKE